MNDVVLKLKSELNIRTMAESLGMDVHGNSARCYNSMAHKNHDRHYSLSFDSHENRYKCFACGESGDVIDLYMKFKGVDFKQAVEDLSGHSIIPQGKVVPEPAQRKGAASPGTAQAIYAALLDFCGGTDDEAMKYLTGPTRGLTVDTIQEFRLSSIRDYGATTKHMIENFSMDSLKASGLFNDDGKLIFYKHKLLIPFLQEGKVIYLQGRRLDDGRPKYLNLREVEKPLFNADVLSGEPCRVFLCEGVFDPIMLQQYGYNGAGILGVESLTDAMIELFRGHEVVLFLDNDDAGQAAMKKIAQRFAHKGLNAKLKKLPTGCKDITEFCIRYPQKRKETPIPSQALPELSAPLPAQAPEPDHMPTYMEALNTLINRLEAEFSALPDQMAEEQAAHASHLLAMINKYHHERARAVAEKRNHWRPGPGDVILRQFGAEFVPSSVNVQRYTDVTKPRKRAIA